MLLCTHIYTQLGNAQASFELCMQAHDSAGGIGSALGSLAGKAVVAAQETSGAIKHKVNAAAF